MSTTTACPVDGKDYSVVTSSSTILEARYDRYSAVLNPAETNILLCPAGTELEDDLADFIRAFIGTEQAGEKGTVRCYLITPGGLRPAYAFGIYPNPHTPDVVECCLYVWTDLSGARQRPPAKAFYFTSDIEQSFAKLKALSEAEDKELVELLCCQPSATALVDWIKANVGTPDSMYLNKGNRLDGDDQTSFWARQEYGDE